MAKRVRSTMPRKSPAEREKWWASSPSDMTGKSSIGRHDSVNRERPERSTSWPSPSALSNSTCEPSGNLRTTS